MHLNGVIHICHYLSLVLKLQSRGGRWTASTGNLTVIESLPHVNDSTDTRSGVHIIEGLIKVVELSAVSDELIDLELALEVVIDQDRKLSAALDTTECRSSPDTTSDKLEG